MDFYPERVCFCFPLQLRCRRGAGSRARRSRGGRGRRGWPSSRTSSWWTGSWWCRIPASTTSTPRPTSDTRTPWRRRRARAARRRRTGGGPCCSTSIRRWESSEFGKWFVLGGNRTSYWWNNFWEETRWLNVRCALTTGLRGTSAKFILNLLVFVALKTSDWSTNETQSHPTGRTLPRWWRVVVFSISSKFS